MTGKEILKAFELEIGLIDDNINKPLVADSMYWLDLALLKFIKLRFNRDFTHHTGFELNEKRFRDLEHLIGSIEFSCKRNLYNGYTDFASFVDILEDLILNQGAPTNYSVHFNSVNKKFVARGGTSATSNKYYNSWPTISEYHDESQNVRQDKIFVLDNIIKYFFNGTKLERVDIVPSEDALCDRYVINTNVLDMQYLLSESVLITDLNGGHPQFVSVFECTHDNYAYRISNSLTDFHYKNYKARPLRIREDGVIHLLTDKNYEIKKYIVSYIRKPYLFSDVWKNNEMDDDYIDINDTVLPEIIKMAAQMYLENAKNDRYKTITQEVLTQE